MSAIQPLEPFEIPAGEQPTRVALIADGHRRWAHANGRSIRDGYDVGVDVATARVLDALELGVEELTFFTFSTENWRRSRREVQALMDIAVERIVGFTPAVAEKGVRIRFVGRRERLSEMLLQRMKWAEGETAANRDMVLYLAFNYGSRAELLDAARRYRGGGESELRNLLYAPDMRDPDLLIRTGGDKRLSNFLLWHCAYSQLIFRDEHFPDFARESFEACLLEYARRQKRVGERTPSNPAKTARSQSATKLL